MEVWGLAILVRLDPFHFLKRLGDASWGKSHPAYGELMADLRDALFAVYEDDKVSVWYVTSDE